MPQSVDPIPSSGEKEKRIPSPSQVRKARMLVSMLGADFAKTSEHPFFQDLARTAVRPVEKKDPPPDMSKALANLVRKLAEPKIASEKSKNLPTRGGVEPEREVTKRGEEQPKAANILTQHPALIAKHLLELSKAERLSELRKLQGKTARQVATYITELNS